jgi:hypothetical protein
MKQPFALSRSSAFVVVLVAAAAVGACSSSKDNGGGAGSAGGSSGAGMAGSSGGASGAAAGAAGNAAAWKTGSGGSDGGVKDGAAETAPVVLNACGAPAMLGSTVVMQMALQGNGDRPTASLSGNVQWLGYLDSNSEPNALEVQLYENAPPFGASFMPMTISLAGQSDFGTCGACVLFHTSYKCGSAVRNQENYIATGGTPTITAGPNAAGDAGTPGHLMATLSNVTFEHVTIDTSSDAGSGFVTTKVADNCTVALPSAAINVDVTTPTNPCP